MLIADIHYSQQRNYYRDTECESAAFIRRRKKKKKRIAEAKTAKKNGIDFYFMHKLYKNHILENIFQARLNLSYSEEGKITLNIYNFAFHCCVYERNFFFIDFNKVISYVFEYITFYL